LILIVKFQDVIIDFLVGNVHKTVDKAEKQDATLKDEQTKANVQADQLRKEANDLSKNKSEVTDDWYKK